MKRVLTTNGRKWAAMGYSLDVDPMDAQKSKGYYLMEPVSGAQSTNEQQMKRSPAIAKNAKIALNFRLMERVFIVVLTSELNKTVMNVAKTIVMRGRSFLRMALVKAAQTILGLALMEGDA